MGKEERSEVEDFAAAADNAEVIDEQVAGEVPAEDKEAQGAAIDEDLSPEEKLARVQEELARKTVEADDYLNRLQRLQADFENFRKRNQKEREEMIRFASEGLICDLLPVLDNFERALSVNGDEQGLYSGVEMIFRQLNEVLHKEGLQPICAVGEKFDPNQHQAVMMVESSDHEDNQIIDEFQKGYTLKDKVIRPAMVRVAKSS
ncbi:MAG: nucleotide exchange factor GrpE [Clostridia bacterium]|nr:nucleotide exchange factor GrpE [Clostridia bacterium]